MIKKCSFLIVGIGTIALLYASMNGLIINGMFSWHVKQPEFQSMVLELFIFGALLACCLVPRWIPEMKAVGSFSVLAVFLWLHAMLIPALVALLYLGYILLLGNLLRILVFRIQTKLNLLVDFFLGSVGLVALFCIMSIFSLGGTWKLFLAMGLLGILLFAFGIVRFRIRKKRIYKAFRRAFTLNQYQGLCIWGIMMFFLVQAGRLNISIDFDSYWYGVRGTFILDNGKGIFENLGVVGMVYTYSKGMEVLTLPLAGLPSYSFLITFNLLLMVLTLYGCYQLLSLFMVKTNGLMVCLWIASVPGIMNMGNTAKSDMLTLLIQVMLLLFQVYYVYEEKAVYFILSICALLFSWTLKPTAMVFSTAIFGMFFLYILWRQKFWLKERIRVWLVLPLTVFVWLCLWLRTFLLTGVPVTSVFSSILTKVGFKMKYPYGSNGVVNYSPNLFSREGLSYMVQRMYGLFVNPSEERMNHAVIAWGTILIPLAVLLILVAVFQVKTLTRGTKELKRMLYVILLPFAAVNVFSMLMLYRPDGNYFMLLYVMVLMTAGICCYHIKNPGIRKGLSLMVIPVLAANLLFTSLVNWSWTLGFSGLTPLTAYVNHQELNRKEMAAAGNEEIWNILAEDSGTRVVAIGFHPQVVMFPCVVQSYYDLWTWCNEDIIHSVSNFKDFLAYAGTDYLYLQKDFFGEGTSYSRMVSRLLLDGIVTDLVCEGGNILGRIELDNPKPEEGRRNYGIFLENYRFFTEEDS